MMQEIKKILVRNLHLWTENPRQPVDTFLSDEEVMRIAIGDPKNKWDLQKLAEQMGGYYDLSELPTVVEIDGKNIVYDGNRRVAVLKYLQNRKLFQSLGEGTFYDFEPIALKELVEIPCNVCNKETALNNVERKHIDSGSWGELERQYFLHTHRNKPKSNFLIIEESTGIISENKKMNQGFVNDEILTIENLRKIGFSIKNEKLVSNYEEDVSKNILEEIIKLVDSKTISTRKNRGKLKDSLLEVKELKDTIKQFDPKKPVKNCSKGNKPVEPNNSRRTSKTRSKEEIFGKTLILESGKVNDLYLAITKIYKKNQNDHTVLSIVGMSLRLILEVAGRVYLKKIGSENSDKDSVYKKFLKQAKKSMSKSNINFLSITQNWIDEKVNMEAILAKYAHGSMPVDKGNILKQSEIVGQILEFYFSRDK